MLDFIVTLLIVFNVPVPHRVPEPLWDSLKRVALIIEIVGPHERWRNDFQSEVSYVRNYWLELKDAPRLHSFQDFYTLNDIANGCSGNMDYQTKLQYEMVFSSHKRYELKICLEESRQIYIVWKTMHEAGDIGNSWVHQRKALKKLRELLGEEDYYNRNIPPPCPYWRFYVVGN